MGVEITHRIYFTAVSLKKQGLGVKRHGLRMNGAHNIDKKGVVIDATSTLAVKAYLGWVVFLDI